MDLTDDLVSEFERIRPQYEAFTKSLHDLLTTLLTRLGIEYFAIEPRTKTVASFSEKIQREEKVGKYSQFSDVTDISGIRIIAYLQEDCDRICQLLSSEFDIDEVNSVKKEEELDPDKFGYLSIHYVLSLGENRSNLLEFSPYRSLKAEVQIRTLLQHTWAAIDWKFRYKEEREAPKRLRRRLFRISALLEAADNEFSNVKNEIDEIRSEYSDSIKRGQLAIPINSESLLAFVSSSKEVKNIYSLVERAGLKLIDEEKQNVQNLLARLIGTSEILGITTLDQFESKLKEIQPRCEEYFRIVVKEVKTVRQKSVARLYPLALLRYSLFIGTTAKQREAINRKYKPAEGYAEAISTASG